MEAEPSVKVHNEGHPHYHDQDILNAFFREFYQFHGDILAAWKARYEENKGNPLEASEHFCFAGEKFYCTGTLDGMTNIFPYEDIGEVVQALRGLLQEEGVESVIFSTLEDSLRVLVEDIFKRNGHVYEGGLIYPSEPREE